MDGGIFLKKSYQGYAWVCTLIKKILHFEYKILEEQEVVTAGTMDLTDVSSLSASSSDF